MNRRTRLMKLETVARNQLPPHGESLFAAWNRLASGAEQEAWLRSLTDAELRALCDSDFSKSSALEGLDWDKLTEADLETIANGTESELAEWADRQRIEKPHYFTKGKQ